MVLKQTLKDARRRAAVAPFGTILGRKTGSKKAPSAVMAKGACGHLRFTRLGLHPSSLSRQCSHCIS